MHALVRFAHIAAGNTFTTAEIQAAVIEALGCAPARYTLASLRYDLSKLRANGLVAKLPNSRRYQLLAQSCLVFLNIACTTGGIADLTQAFSVPSNQTPGSTPKGDPGLTVSISVSSMISTRMNSSD